MLLDFLGEGFSNDGGDFCFGGFFDFGGGGENLEEFGSGFGADAGDVIQFCGGDSFGAF